MLSLFISRHRGACQEWSEGIHLVIPDTMHIVIGSYISKCYVNPSYTRTHRDPDERVSRCREICASCRSFPLVSGFRNEDPATLFDLSTLIYLVQGL